MPVYGRYAHKSSSTVALSHAWPRHTCIYNHFLSPGHLRKPVLWKGSESCCKGTLVCGRREGYRPEWNVTRVFLPGCTSIKPPAAQESHGQLCHSLPECCSVISGGTGIWLCRPAWGMPNSPPQCLVEDAECWVNKMPPTRAAGLFDRNLAHSPLREGHFLSGGI